ncbi:BolA/IbaG family iron-sulfur metabolism protein [Candidatus Schneideria nysicola]|uniref:BolA family protein n=1 Tax=Candidatus Schneideria nysicola TaxID=1081631 RepID=UPI001CAA48CF|nr:BolA/IbaG family iron-sulfur metabolism protein [Candidatus Schneideria nysicola]UAJ64892.1 BolA/IbaG family iron-sulfur metabolism protein [Candidatus Schneideria nysicola]
MKEHEIVEILKKNLDLDQIFVKGDGNHFQIVAISNIFRNMSYVEKQQVIYSLLMEFIINKQIHAVSIKTLTPDEWKNHQNYSDIIL